MKKIIRTNFLVWILCGAVVFYIQHYALSASLHKSTLLALIGCIALVIFYILVKVAQKSMEAIKKSVLEQ